MSANPFANSYFLDVGGSIERLHQVGDGAFDTFFSPKLAASSYRYPPLAL